jgi:hypothetical protein
MEAESVDGTHVIPFGPSGRGTGRTHLTHMHFPYAPPAAERQNSPAAAAGEALNAETLIAAAVRCSGWFG